jgi:hypothetical protein
VVKLTPDKQDKFLIALDNNNQKHIANYIRANGDRSKAAANWPLLKSYEIKKWDYNRSNIVNFLGARNGLLGEMLAAGCINNRLKQEIEAKETDAQANDEIFRAIRQKNVVDYHTFIECLKKTKQYHVVFLLEPDAPGTVPPLNQAQQASINASYASLVSVMDMENGLIYDLIAEGCIT